MYIYGIYVQYNNMKMTNKIITIILIFMIFSFNNLIKYTDDVTKQLIFFIVGLSIVSIISHMSLKHLYKFIIPIYIILNILLLYLLIFGNRYNGSRAWIDLKYFTIQPSEFMKITLIILLSIIASSNQNYPKVGFILTLIPSVLTFLEPDTGNVIFYIVIYLSILFYRLKNIKLLLKVTGVIVVFGSLFLLLYFFNKGLFIDIFGSSFFYRMDRITGLFTSSYQLDMALINMGSGGLLGLNDIYSIPEATTDFAFSLMVSLTGFIGSLIYIVVNIIFMNILVEKIKNNDNIVIEYITFSFLMMYLVQSSIHIAMNIGLFPITGITLPFISYGGSSLIAYFIMIGIISNYHMGNKDSYS